jgi:hypothetical protein
MMNVRIEPGETLEAAYEQTFGDGAMYLSTDCADTQSTVACSDGIPPQSEFISYTNAGSAAQDLTLVLDNWGGGGLGPPGGPFTLRLSIQ